MRVLVATEPPHEVSMGARATLGDYLDDTDPLGTLVRDLSPLVRVRGKRAPRPELLTEAARAVYWASCFHADVMSGRFSRFFAEANGPSAETTIRALTQVGATRAASLLSRALDAFPSRAVPQDLAARRTLLSDVEEREPTLFNELDEAYHRLVGLFGSPPVEDRRGLLISWLETHASDPVAA